MAINQKKWTKDECEYLIENLNLLSYNEISLNLNRSLQSVKSKVNKTLKLHKAKNNSNKLEQLLLDNNISWYWLGFITGDGSFNEKYLRVTVSGKDNTHIKKLALLLNTNINITNKGYCNISIYDPHNIKNIKNKIGINLIKTYNAISLDLNTIEEEYALSFIIGLIDADGSIELQKISNKGKSLKIELHESWYHFLVHISNYLSLTNNINSKVIINSRNYALFRITSHFNILSLKKIIKRLNIPYLNRKWDLISDDMSNINFFDKNKKEIINRYINGDNIHKISKDLNLNYNSIYNHIDEIKNIKENLKKMENIQKNAIGFNHKVNLSLNDIDIYNYLD